MEKHKPMEKIQAGWDSYERPNNGDVYQHYKGGNYEIIATGFFEESLLPCIIYRSLDKDIVWVRPAKGFLEDVEYQNEMTPRFRLLNG